MKSLFPHL